MSWQAGSFAVLGLVLLGGFAWYERSRPASQVVALVAALAALAVAGRLLLAPIPNVKPTTDIVIFSGYALGAAPGFAVGALAALVSNFWLGQGPWTPWQMTGWGLCGVLGAALAIGGRRQIGRWQLAAVCGLAGIAYGALLNFSLMVTYGGEVSLDRFIALSGRAVPFDLAHALGNVALALVAGPAILRMLVRFRERFEFRWRIGSPVGAIPRTGLGRVAVVLAALAIAAGALAARPEPARAETGLAAARAWLERVQNADGGYPASPGEESSAEMTSWAMLGLEAAGRNPLDVREGGNSAVAFLRRNIGEVSSPGDLGRTILALRGAGIDPRGFGGRDLVAELRSRRRADGSWVGWPNSTAFAVLALRAAGSPAGLGHSLAWLRRVQGDDGGWGAVPGAPSDPDSTGAVLQAIRGSRSARRALAYLRRSQQSGGGFSLATSGPVNTQSTAWAIQGMLAAGSAPSGSTLGYIAAQQAADGHYRYSASSDQTSVWVTGQVLVAVAAKPFPLAPVSRAPSPAPAEQPGGAGPVATAIAAGEAEGAGGRKGGGAAGEALSERGRGDRGGAQAAPRDTSGRVGGTADQQTTNDDDGGASPLLPVGLGIGAGGLALGAAWWFGRRRGD
jgi:energy-coupling factor transport system substrate-specific component